MMLYPRQPHMHVWRFCSAVSQVHIHKHTLFECVRPRIPSECASLGEGRGWWRKPGVWGWDEKKRQGGARSDRVQGSPPSLNHISPSFTPSISHPSLLSKSWVKSLCLPHQSSSHPLSNCAHVYVCNIYKYISISGFISVETCSGWG